MKGYDIVGNIAIVKFERGDSLAKKKSEAKELMNSNKNITSVLEKSDKFKGRLRTLKTKFILGEKTKEALYKENGCMFRFNVDTCYFSPRLSNERIEISRLIKKDENVLVLFGGVAPFAIVIAKNSNVKKVVSVELGRECSKYALENVRRNKLNNVEIMQGDVKKILPKIKDKFDRIVMARPNLNDSFLDIAFPKVKKSGTIHYYGFYEEGKVSELKELIENEAKKAKRKIKILEIKKAGDIGLRKYRFRVDFLVLN